MPADDQLNIQSGFDSDITDHELHREESFKVEALEPRILLSADPLTGELARLAEDAGRYDPAAEVAALVQQLDAIEVAPEAAPETSETTAETDAEIVWPEAWIAEDTATDDTSVEMDATLVAAPAEPETTVDDTALNAVVLDLSQSEDAAPEGLLSASAVNPVGQAADKGHDAQAPPVQKSEAQQNNAETEIAPHGAFGIDTHYLTYSGANSGPTGVDLTLAQARTMFDFAVAEWRQALGDDSLFADLQIAVADLPDGKLGQITGTLVTLDTDAAGNGWFIDTTPETDTEFSAVVAGVDLLTAIRHEVGHAAGYDHDAGFALMDATLGQAERHGIPAALPAAGAPVEGYLTDTSDGTLTDTDPATEYFYVIDNSGLVTVFRSDNSVPGQVLVVESVPIENIAGITTIDASEPDVGLTEIDTLVLPTNVSAVVNLSGVNAGTVSFDDASSIADITFSSIESIQFGDVDDRLVIDDAGFITGTITQGLGTFEVSIVDVISILFDEATPSAALSITAADAGVTKVSTTGGTDETVTLKQLSIALANGTVFIGDQANGYFAGAAHPTGVEIADASFTLNLYSDDTDVWINLQATLGKATLVGVDDVVATIYNAGVTLITEAAGFVIGGTEALIEITASATLAVNDNVLIAGTARLVLTNVSDVNDGTETGDGQLFAVGISGATIFGGIGADFDVTTPATPQVDLTGASGFYANDIDATLAILTTVNGDYVGFTLDVAKGEIRGIPDTTATVSNFAVAFNTGLDWTQAPLDAAALTLDGNLFRIASQAELLIDNSLLLAATFELSITTPNAGEELLTISVTNAFAFAGNGNVTVTRTNGVVTDFIVDAGAQGFRATGVTFELAVYTTTTESFAAIYASAQTVTPEGINGLTLVLSDLLFRANFADATAGAFDWAGSSLDLIATPNIAAFDDTERLDIAVTIDELNIADAVLLTGTIAVTTAQGIEIDGVTGDLLYLELSDFNVFAGQGAVLDASGLNSDDASGLLATGGSFALGIFTDTTSGTQYTGVQGALSGVSALGVPSVTIELTGFAFVYNAATTGANLNWSAAVDAPGLDELVVATDLAISGTLLVAVESNFIATATFGLVTKTQTVDDGVITSFTGSVLIFTLSEASVWAGTGFVLEGTAGSRSVNEDNATGFKVEDVTIELVIVNEMTTGPPVNSWSAVYVDMGEVTPVGLPSDLIFTLTNVTFGINNAAVDGTKLDWTALDGNTAGLIEDLPTNIATFTNAFGIAFGGSVEIQVAGSILVAVNRSEFVGDHQLK